MKPKLYKGFVIRQVRTHVVPGAGLGLAHFPLNKYTYSSQELKQSGESNSMWAARQAIDALVKKVAA